MLVSYGSPARTVAGDAGLRRFLLRVYLRLTGGLVLAAALAWTVAEVAVVRDVFFVADPQGGYGFTFTGYVLLLSPLAVLLLGSAAVSSERPGSAGALYWIVAGLIGGSLGALALSFTGAALTSTFIVAAATFAALSLTGMITRRNLSGLGHFLAVVLIGLIISLVLNLFLRSPGLYLALNAIGVVVFAGLIAADTQQLRHIYYERDYGERLGPAADLGALTLFLNFVNLFQFLLSFTGGRSRR